MKKYTVICLTAWMLPLLLGLLGRLVTSDVENVLFLVILGTLAQGILCVVDLLLMRRDPKAAKETKVLAGLGVLPFTVYILLFVAHLLFRSV